MLSFEYLRLTNFGIFYGNQLIDFYSVSSDQSITLIGGLNGRGKTTIFDALLLVLYGKNSFAFIESNLSYSEYLSQHINNHFGIDSASVKISMTIIIENETYNLIVDRSWTRDNKKTSEIVIVYRDGEIDKYLTETWDTFIDSIIPSDISKFFFFDGEKIAKIAQEDSDIYIKSSICSLMGLDRVEQLNNDLKRVIKRNISSSDIFKGDEQISALEKKIEEHISLYKKLEHELELVDINTYELNQNINEEEKIYQKAGGKISEMQKDHEKNKEVLRIRNDNLNAKLRDISASELPLLLVKPLLNSIYLKLCNYNDINENIIINKHIDSIENSIFQIIDKYDFAISCKEAISEYFILNYKLTNPNYALSDYSYNHIKNQIDHLFNSIYTIKDAFEALYEEKALIEHEMAQNAAYLETDTDELIASKMLHEIKKKYLKLGELESSKRLIQQSINEHKNEAVKIDKDLRALLQTKIASIETKRDVQRIIEYSNKSIEVMEEYSRRLQRYKTTTLAAIMTEETKRILNKKSLITNISIDAISLDTTLWSSDVKLLKGRLSAGERQMLAVAMLASLSKAAGNKLPVLIDTPLARLDSKHRKNFVKEYLPHASKQVIVLSTDEEIVGKYLTMIEPNLHKKYLLKYDEETLTTSVIEGYFEDRI